MAPPEPGRGSATVHAVSLAAFALLSLLFTRPLALHLHDAIIGAGPFDNMSAIWNIWWARTALHGPSALLWTPALFAPLGTGLVLHSFAPLESVLAGATPLDPVASYNIALIAAVFLNLACAYWACWSITRDPLASCVAAVTFGGAPFLLVRLHGHLNVLNAWGLPLLLMATRRHLRIANWSGSALLGLTIAVLAYTDAYFAIFGVILAAAYLVLNRWPIRLHARPLTVPRRRALQILGALIAVVCALIGWIEWTGGADTEIAGIRLRMTDTFNPRVALGFLISAAILTWKWPAVRSDPVVPPLPRRAWSLLPAVLAVAVGLCAPLLLAGVQSWRAGDYQSQVYFWRSAPPGIDLAAMMLGNPGGLLIGRWSAAAYAHLGIDRTESAVWLGLAAMAVIALGFSRLTSRVEARSFLWIAGLFLVWSLGPYLRVFGLNTAFMLPQTVLRFVPIVANARIPGRAFVVVFLMAGLLAGMVLSAIPDRRRRTLAGLAALGVGLLDFLPAAHPWIAADRPSIYATLRSEPPGTVLEIPLGLRDGLGQRGSLDHRVLLYQTVHGHPQMGGFVARLSGRIKRAYDSDPILGPILDLSEPRPTRRAAPADATTAPGCQLTCAVRYVVIDEEHASNELRAFAARAFSLRLLERSGPRALYVVEQ